MSQLSSSPRAENCPLFVGIDWGDVKHDVCVIDDEGTSKHQTFEHDPDAIANWLDQLRQQFSGRTLLIAIEQSRGALVYALQQSQGVMIYPINPKQLARYREAVYPGGRKNDPNDAELLALLLFHHRQKMRAWEPDSFETSQLVYLSEMRRTLVDDRKALGLRLMSILKVFFPLVLTLFKKPTISPFVLDLLERWPSLAQLKQARPKTLAAFLDRHHVQDEEQQEKWINAIRAATHLTEDPALILTHARYAQAIARQIAALNRSVAEFEAEIRRVVADHPDQAIFRSLPGAGDALVPRLIAAFGSNRNRYKSANAIQSYSGIAPITRRSGNSCSVLQRRFCPRFLKQTFHEFADQARIFSGWSGAFYRLKKSQGMKHNAAVRALAFKWIRIIFQLWKNKDHYSEKDYVKSLVDNRSPVIAFLEKT